jgi:hypothetical protein
MVGEKRLKTDKFGLSYDDNEPYNAPGWDSEIVRFATRDVDQPTGTFGPSPDVRFTDPAIFVPDPNSGLSQFGSSHPSGINAAMSDGSVRIIRFNPAGDVFRRACVRNDGLVFNPDDI